jgi:hypothetical protein
MPFLLPGLRFRVKSPDRSHKKHDAEDAMPALHAGIVFGHDKARLSIEETVHAHSVPQNAGKVTRYCQGAIECKSCLNNNHVFAKNSGGMHTGEVLTTFKVSDPYAGITPLPKDGIGVSHGSQVVDMLRITAENITLIRNPGVESIIHGGP